MTASARRMPLTDVWCAIPVYNNSATIADVAKRAREQLENVLVIDDGSTDADLADLLKPLDITVIRHPTNRGKGAALLTAMRHAHEHGAKYLITLDGDGQHFPEDIPRFFTHLSPACIAIGHRHEITGEMPQSSRFGREFSDFWIHVESGGNVLDSQSGFRAYPLPACLDLNVHSIRYGFEVEILTKALWSGLRCASVTIRVYYPPRQQRVSSFHPLRDNIRLTRLHTKLIARQLLPLRHRPIRIQTKDLIHHGDTGDAENSNYALNFLCVRPASRVNDALKAALTAGISVFFGIVLWPWGFIPVLYIAVRLHLNTLLAIACLLVCLPKPLAILSSRIGHDLVHSSSHPQLERFIGSHLIALPACIAAAALAYTVARMMHRNLEA